MKKLNNLSWILYPILVAAFIIISSQLLLDPVRWQGLVTNQEKIAEQEVQIQNLRTKLTALNSVDLQAAQRDLKYLVSAMPNSKMVWFLVSELKLSASEGGVTIQDYKGNVGKGIAESSDSAVAVDDQNLSIKVSLNVTTLDGLKSMLASLDKRLPLVKISRIEFSDGSVSLVADGAWSPSKKVTGNEGEILEYISEVNKAKSFINGFIGFPEVVVASMSGEMVTDPF